MAPEALAALPPRLARVIGFWESVAPAELGRVADLYAPDARFVDPFNDVRGPEAIAAIVAHMFVQVRSPRFIVHEALAQGDGAMLVWDFEFEFAAPLPPRPRRVHGCTHLRFGADDRVVLHRDYWDAAGELYGSLPVLGALMRWLRRRNAAPAHGHAGRRAGT